VSGRHRKYNKRATTAAIQAVAPQALDRRVAQPDRRVEPRALDQRVVQPASDLLAEPLGLLAEPLGLLAELRVQVAIPLELLRHVAQQRAIPPLPVVAVRAG
jgi:hypothetical protein